MRNSHRTVAILIVFYFFLCATIQAAGYDPLVVPKAAKVETVDLTVHDADRKRDIPIRIYLPAAKGKPVPAPVVLFSHGLGGSRAGAGYLGEHWAGRGYVVVCLQHPGSDEAVWKNEPWAQRMAAMKRAASAENFLLRVRDVPVVLDQLEAWNREKGHRLAGRLDLTRVGMAGHSFGAVTTQAVSGQAIPLGGQPFTDSRIRAALALSPSSPRRGDPATAFGSVKIPWMLMTGTHDTAPIGDQTAESRRRVYPALPATIEKYELVLFNAEHSAFSARALPGDRQPRNPNHHRAIKALSTAFWDAHLRNNAEARAWLHGPGAKSVLEAKDQWQLNAIPRPK
ncbi:MAG: dienelactone hydrolase [Pirellulales bacterium]|nr:dienelactone hydrolase [Pirellulales bacterium]